MNSKLMRLALVVAIVAIPLAASATRNNIGQRRVAAGTTVSTSVKGGMSTQTHNLSTGSVSAGSQVFELRLVGDNGSVFRGSVGVHDGEGLLFKLATAADGRFQVIAEPGTKLILVPEGADGLVTGAPGFAGVRLPVSANGTIDVSLNTPVIGEEAPADGGPTCDAAEAIAVPGLDPAGTNVGNPSEFDADCGGTLVFGGAGSWYNVTGTGSRIVASTCGAADFDTMIKVFRLCGTSCSGDTLICVAGNDDAPGCGLTSETSWDSAAGAQYRVLVTGFAAEEGNFTLTMSDGGANAADPTECLGSCCSCLNAPFDCTVDTQANCEAAGSTYNGDGTACTVPNGGTFAAESFPAAAIPDNNPLGITDNINVPPLPDLVGDVNVTLELTHTFIADLTIEITHGGQTENLWDERCIGAVDFHSIADADGGTTLCAEISDPTLEFYDQTVAGLGDLNAVEGAFVAGDWTLSVADNFAADTGTLDHWALDIILADSACAASSN